MSDSSPTTNHNGCFGQECGPTQHLLHVYVIPGKLLSIKSTAPTMIQSFHIASPPHPISAPETPPPKLFFV